MELNHLYTLVLKELVCIKRFPNVVQTMHLVIDSKTVDRVPRIKKCIHGDRQAIFGLLCW